jgi:hypothetical protein
MSNVIPNMDKLSLNQLRALEKSTDEEIRTQAEVILSKQKSLAEVVGANFVAIIDAKLVGIIRSQDVEQARLIFKNEITAIMDGFNKIGIHMADPRISESGVIVEDKNLEEADVHQI